MKICRTCRQSKPVSEFYSDSHYADRKKADCIVCYSAANLARMKKNREKVNAQKRVWEEKNKEKVLAWSAAWRKKNPEKCADGFRQWAKINRAKINVNNGKRRAAKRNAFPLWADKEKIAQIYAKAAELNANGGDVHVDHIYPLQSEFVCGLHVHNNLQILPAFENISKHNRVIEQRMFA